MCFSIINDLHWEYTAAEYPYKTLVGGNTFCQSECHNDILCNGYLIDESNDGCFLSRCTTPASVPVYRHVLPVSSQVKKQQQALTIVCLLRQRHL